MNELDLNLIQIYNEDFDLLNLWSIIVTNVIVVYMNIYLVDVLDEGIKPNVSAFDL